ncbi:MAG TPA: ABC transporter permease, partial [Vicinamibacterales bacterium]|nr:ABC transporter permease [Vicinamibacterales bacterium]
MSAIYRALLRLLPRARRARFGDEMAVVFDDLRAEASRAGGRRAAVAVWMREVAGMVRFSIREVVARIGRLFERLSPGSSGGRWNPGVDFRMAWRALRARPWRAALTMGLLAVVLSANTIVFTLVDALAFNKANYPAAEELAQIQHRTDRGRTSEFLSPAAIERWQAQSDLFAGVEAWARRSIFIVRDGTSQGVGLVDVTPGMMSTLSVSPAWGRPFVPDDAAIDGAFHVVVSEGFAREHFGRPEAAVGRRLETSHLPLIVVGVMPATFRFPDGGPRIWRALSLRGPLTGDRTRFETIVRLAPGVPREAARAAVQARSMAIGRGLGLAAPPDFLLTDAGVVTPHPEERALSWLLLGVAFVLLLVACANVAAIETSAAAQRSKTFALQHALGASPLRMASVVLIEGALLMGGAAAAALGLTVVGLQSLLSVLPPRLLTYSANAIDVDPRSLVFMIALAAVTWLLAAMPAAARAVRQSPAEVLVEESRSSSSGRHLARRVLTSVQVAAAVVLLVGGGLFVRTYVALLGGEKGFDSRNVAAITASFSNQAHNDRTVVLSSLVERLSALDGVESVAVATAPPGFGENHSEVHVAVDGGELDPIGRPISFQGVEPAYFSVLNLPLRKGRFLQETDPPTAAVISESFARTYWPGIDPMGRTFSFSRRGAFEVVGVMGDMRDVTEAITGRERLLFVHRRPPPAPVVPLAASDIDDGGSWGYLSVIARLDSRERAGTVLAAARGIDPRFAMRLEFVDDEYAEAFGPYLLGARLIGSMALVAFAVAFAGVYGVMASVVTDRARELGIRVALGATRRDVYQLVLGSSGRMAAVGAAAGALVAWALALYAQSTIPGLTGAGPLLVGTVAGLVLLTAVAATWHPA